MNDLSAADLLRELQETGETSRIEAKRGTEAGKSVLETVCAFANEPGLGGSYLLLGVERVSELFGTRYVAVGVPNAEKVQEDLASQVNTVFNRRVRLQMQAETVEGLTLIGIFVGEAPAAEKPIYLRGRGLPGGAFRRDGPTDVSCVEDDLLTLYQNRSQAPYDASPVPGATWDDLSLEALEDYRRERRITAPAAVELTYPLPELALTLNAVAEQGGGLVPTVAGLLLFGTAKALRRFFPLMRVDYIRVPGRQWVENPDDRFASLDMRDPLMQVVRRAEAAVVDDLPKSFRLREGDLQRTDVLPIPQRVLREAIVNAVMHRSYREHSPVQIIRYANRIEIVNPGYSLKPRERLGERRSETRNPGIAAVLHETRFAETKGSGIQTMRQLMKQEGLLPPTFDSDRQANEFTVRLLLHHFLDPADHDWLAAFAALNLSGDERLALIFVREVGAIDNATFRELTALDPQHASYSLRRLRDSEVLELKGKGAGTYYVAGPRLRDAPALPATDTPLAQSGSAPDTQSGMAGGLSGMAGGLSGMAGGLSGMAGGLSGMAGGLSGMAGGLSGMARPAMPAALAARLAQLGERTSVELLRETLVALCRWQPHERDELARQVGRNPKYVSSLLNELLKEKRVQYTIPDMPRHPGQTYWAD